MQVETEQVNKPISDKKRYILRLLDMAKTDTQLGATTPKEGVWESSTNPALTCDQIISTFFDAYADRPALGIRNYKVIKQEISGRRVRSYQPDFDMTTYGEFHNQIKAMSMAWRSHDASRVSPGDFVCVMGFASLEFVVIDTACAFSQATVVPLQSSTSGGDLAEIFSNIEPVCLATTIDDLQLAAEHAAKQPSIRSVIVFNYDAAIDEERETVEKTKVLLSASNTALVSYDELIEYGKEKDFEYLPARANEDNEIGAIIHSSGSTGKPKGAVISNKAQKNNWRGSKKNMFPRITVSMAPLNHVMGRMNLMGTLCIGGTVYFTLKSDMSSLFEDIRIARPTYLSFFPRVFELIYQHYQNEVTRRSDADERNLKEIEDAVKAEMKNTYLGDRLLGGVVGSAPTSPKVKEFIKSCFDILLLEGYGNTETGSGGIAMDGRINRAIVIDYKLTDVPELGYYITDKPYPRGELCVKTEFGVQSYYKQPNATAGLNDADGYNKTGDIVEERGQDHIVIIDRRKDVLKLSQGEYVAVGTLGTVFEAGSPCIKQIYVYGNSHRAYLLAAVIPEIQVVKNRIDGEMTESKIKNVIRAELQEVAQNEKLRSFEVPRDFILDEEPFSQKNGLLSSVRKRLRPALKKKYGPLLEALYEEHDRNQEGELEALKDVNSSLTTKEKLVKLLESNLGYKDFEKKEARTYNQLGGDSMGAALFSVSIEDIFDVSIGADVILGPGGHIQQWADLIDAELNQENIRPTFTSVHGKGCEVVHADDLELGKFMDQKLIDDSGSLTSSPEVPNVVLLTGANGFLGHMLCYKWMEELSGRDGKLICIIRAPDNEAAKKRLDQKFNGLDAHLAKRYHDLAEKNLEVLAGDIGKPLLGLDADTYNRISNEVDRITHAAALVNHRLAYTHLFGPNVLGTAEIIQLSLTQTKKPIDFISTIGVLGLLERDQQMNEKTPLLQSVKLSDHYAAGYATSKWASEHMLRRANASTGLVCNIIRCSMILADEEHQGHINVDDMFTRLLYSIVKTGLVPKSFYRPNIDGANQKAHYDGIPVNVLSEIIINLYQQDELICRTLNAQNYLDDDASLDRFVDWIESAGYTINRIDEHSQWYERLEDKLKSLPESERQRSMINLLPAYTRQYPRKEIFYGTDQFQIVAQKVNGGIPHLSESYIHKCLRDMVSLGLIRADN